MVETGMTDGEGVSVGGAGDETSGENPPVEHAPRIRVQRRSVRKIIRMLN